MKKFITFAAVAAFTMMASATSLKWGYGGGYLYVSEDGAAAAMPNAGGVIPSGAQMRLIYLGSATTYDISAVSDAMVVDTYDLVSNFDGTDDYAKTTYKTYEVMDGKNVTALDGTTAITMGSNDNFGVVFWDGDSYEYIYSVEDYTAGTMGAALKEVANIGVITPTAHAVFLNGTASATQDEWEIEMGAVLHTSQPTPPIPEPATAALALLGLGMMFRRRRA